jgi:tRNA(adenine34) deaminase
MQSDGTTEPSPPDWSQTDLSMMHAALAEATAATDHDDVPIGAVVAIGDTIVARSRNERELLQDPTAHAEILALRAAAEHAGSWRVLDATLYVTLEPCSMCAGAIVLSRIPRVVFGAPDPKAGACGSVLDVTGEPKFNHRPLVEGGLLATECGDLLRDFFAARR